MKKIFLSFLLLLSLTPCVFANEKIPEQENPYLLLEAFGTAFQTIRKDYVDPIEDKKLVESAINGMLASLDPHSGFMNKKSFEDMQVQTKGEFGGLGVEVTMENGWVRVVSPIDDTPAFKAGLKPGDYFTHIDGVAIMGMTLNQAVDKMRGKPDTKITLTISRKGEKPFDITLKRAIIHIQSVKHEAKENIGYIRISSFMGTTADGVKKAIEDLNKEIGKDKVLGYLIDLRNNPGGLLDQAVGVVDLFLDKGEIVSTRSKRPEETLKFTAKKGDITNKKPIVVLINEGSASASEIVAGALQDHHRALIVGNKSFGKGSVQTIIPMPGYGALRMTTARYYTPSGRSIQAKGIQPDILIKQAKIEEVSSVLDRYSEAALPGAIGEKEGQKAPHLQKKKKENQDDSKEEETKTDYQLERALDILKGISIYKGN
ncbi:MAG: S41 family peptidase [Alphaproteobacteria bacterium]|nr:S41 family peptidase [Alphaproteobacteria bacterium]NCB49616.1 S41 family peptidase [Alphaproteobacteria bacterium]